LRPTARITNEPEDLAAGFGLTFQQIQKYKQGTNRMGSSRLAHAAEVLGVTPAYFFESPGGSESATPNDPRVDWVTGFLGTKDGQALVRAFQSIESKATRRAIADMVAELAGTAD
jgi:transcriptional regulator with XRE-family HTH domain